MIIKKARGAVLFVSNLSTYPVILMILGFFCSSFSRTIHHPWLHIQVSFQVIKMWNRIIQLNGQHSPAILINWQVLNPGPLAHLLVIYYGKRFPFFAKKLLLRTNGTTQDIICGCVSHYIQLGFATLRCLEQVKQTYSPKIQVI